MSYSGVVFSDVRDRHTLELKLDIWFQHLNTMTRSPEFKYWKALVCYPIKNDNERFFILLRYLEEIEKDDSLFNISSAFQLTEIYLKYVKTPPIIKQVLRNANLGLRDHLVHEYPIMGRFASIAMFERGLSARKVS